MRGVEVVGATRRRHLVEARGVRTAIHVPRDGQTGDLRCRRGVHMRPGAVPSVIRKPGQHDVTRGRVRVVGDVQGGRARHPEHGVVRRGVRDAHVFPAPQQKVPGGVTGRVVHGRVAVLRDVVLRRL